MIEEFIEVYRNGVIIKMYDFVYYAMRECRGN